jgi:hypothetical protein
MQERKQDQAPSASLLRAKAHTHLYKTLFAGSGLIIAEEQAIF